MGNLGLRLKTSLKYVCPPPPSLLLECLFPIARLSAPPPHVEVYNWGTALVSLRICVSSSIVSVTFDIYNCVCTPPSQFFEKAIANRHSDLPPNAEAIRHDVKGGSSSTLFWFNRDYLLPSNRALSLSVEQPFPLMRGRFSRQAEC